MMKLKSLEARLEVVLSRLEALDRNTARVRPTKGGVLDKALKCVREKISRIQEDAEMARRTLLSLNRDIRA